MRMPRLFVLGAVLLMAGPAVDRPAEAGAWEWLERLSGPGPFFGWSENVPVVCGPSSRAKKGAAESSSKVDTLWHCWRQVPAPLASVLPGLPSRRWHASVYFGRLSTDDNGLEYTRATPDRDVILWRLGLRGTWHHSRHIDVHAGAIANRFSNKRRLFETFTRPSFDAGVTLRPFTTPDRALRYVTFPVQLDWLPGSITAFDFGAAGTWEGGREVRLNLAIAIDVFSH